MIVDPKSKDRLAQALYAASRDYDPLVPFEHLGLGASGFQDQAEHVLISLGIKALPESSIDKPVQSTHGQPDTCRELEAIVLDVLREPLVAGSQRQADDINRMCAAVDRWP